MKLIQGNCLEVMKSLSDNSVDLLFTDPPYALGSEVIIGKNGKPDYKKAVDFMAKWEQPNGEFWEKWFIEAMRILKFGGRVVMFGMDRQLMLNKYYACFAGFVEQQSLYWYFCSNFPKSSDLSKNIDKYFGEEREVIGRDKCGKTAMLGKMNNNIVSGDFDLTSPTHPLVQKYNGFKYSISPLKQTCETIMVFQKPYKTGSCLHDTLAFENGDESITVAALDIENNKVAINPNDPNQRPNGSKVNLSNGGDTSMFKIGGRNPNINGNTLDMLNGRYPSQTFIDSEVAEVLDGQSGDRQSGGGRVGEVGKRRYYKSLIADTATKNKVGNFEYIKNNWSYDPIRDDYFELSITYSDIGGCSKILHKCDYDEIDYDLFIYCPKVSKSERNKGMEGESNNHPTLKPIKLLSNILKLFKTPNPQTVLDCFLGSGSIGIASKREGFDFIGIELDKDYFEIAKKRIANVAQAEITVSQNQETKIEKPKEKPQLTIF